MAYYTRNKNELLSLVGAVYAFVAYLTAFSLEVLFIIDLVKENEFPYAHSGQILSNGAPIAGRQVAASSLSPLAGALEQARSGLDSAQSYITVPCLALSILYFVTFIASLVLIVGLILRSTFFLLIWICIMATLCLPEFGLVVYVSIYAWGIETRNGQTELLFYLLRGGLNVIFIHRAYRLFRHWNDEKNFFMLKSGSRFSSGTGYDSPYFVGDSLTTTINPVFSSSTLNLSPYDNTRTGASTSPIFTTSRNLSPTNDASSYLDPRHRQYGRERVRKSSSSKSRDNQQRYSTGENLELEDQQKSYRSQPRRPMSMLSTNATDLHGRRSQQHRRHQDNEFGDDFIDDFEMDLDYRTLTHQQHYSTDADSTRDRRSVNHYQRSYTSGALVSSPSGLSYSTQSLDRKHLRDMDYALPEQVILRPLGHQPFEYLHRPGSSLNLTSNAQPNLNTQPFSGESHRDNKNRYL